MLYYIKLNLTKVLLVLVAVLLITSATIGIVLFFQNRESIAPYDTNPFPEPEITEPVAPTSYPSPPLDPELANQPVAPEPIDTPEPQPMNPNESDPDFFEVSTIISQAKDYIVQGIAAGTISPKKQDSLGSLPSEIDKVPSYAIPANYNIQATWNSDTYDVCIQIEFNNQFWFQKNNEQIDKGSC